MDENKLYRHFDVMENANINSTQISTKKTTTNDRFQIRWYFIWHDRFSWSYPNQTKHLQIAGYASFAFKLTIFSKYEN